MPRFAAEQLSELARELFICCGIPDADAALVADHLVEAGLSGHDTHSLLRLPQYVGMVRDGSVHPGAPLKVLADHRQALRVSGQWNFGPVTATAAMRLAIQRTRQAALTVVSVRDCNHVARLGGFAGLAAAERMIAVVMANGHGGDLAVAPPGGGGRRLSTNPLCVAIPTDVGWPIILDMTTSAVSGGQLRLLRNLGDPVAPHTVVDASGQMTTDVEAYYGPPPGALLPLGAPLEAYKGFSLGLMVDILAGALSGAGCSRAEAESSGNALFIAVLRVDAFVDFVDFAAAVGGIIDRLHANPPAAGSHGVSLPGEHSYLIRQERAQLGVPVDAAAWQQISALAAEYGVPLPQPLAS
jgi:hydroxycarboxylate dehydrogenase B